MDSFETLLFVETVGEYSVRALFLGGLLCVEFIPTYSQPGYRTDVFPEKDTTYNTTSLLMISLFSHLQEYTGA